MAVIGGGGHPSKFVEVDDGLLLDMSTLKSIQVNPIDQWAITQTGVTWREFDQVTQAFGLACTGASVPDAALPVRHWWRYRLAAPQPGINL